MTGITASILAIVIFVMEAFAYYLGFRRGRDQVLEEQRKETEKAEEIREKKEDEVSKLDDHSLDDRLDPWMRDR